MQDAARLIEAMDTMRQTVRLHGIPVRRKDGALYAMLASCLGLCQDVQRLQLEDAIKDRLGDRPALAGRNRRYVFQTTDVYVLVARYVLEGVDERNSVYRYATTLRRAAEFGLERDTMAEWLATEGGVNALFRTRQVEARTATTRTLHLSSPVTVVKDAPFTVTLQRRPDGFFNVLGQGAIGEVAA
jgi:hypothetical protein